MSAHTKKMSGIQPSFDQDAATDRTRESKGGKCPRLARSWIRPAQVVKVADGHQAAVSEFLDNLESVVGNDTLLTSLDFLRITSRENRIQVFIRIPGLDEVRTEAMWAIKTDLADIVRKTCPDCGTFQDDFGPCTICRPAPPPDVDDCAAADFPAAIADESEASETSVPAPHPTVKVFEKGDIDLLAKQAKVMADREHRDRLEAVVKRLRGGTEMRSLSLAPAEDQLTNFRARFPNLAAVTDFVIEQAALASLGDGRFHLPPILLLGDAGVGKTAWSQALAELAGVKTAIHDMASVAVGAGLSGSDAYWANTRTGVIFDMIVWGEHANPVVIVDEIDKSGGDGRYDPMGPLYRLLEPISAKKFEDLSLPGFRFDASWLNVVATANEADRIPAPILSRFQVFKVPTPTTDQVRTIAQHVYCDILSNNSWGSWFQPTLADDVLDVVSTMAPRAIRKLFGRALGIAAMVRRDHIVPSDITLAQAAGQRRMGFV